MKKFLLLLSIFCVTHATNFAQKEITYINPPAVIDDGYSLAVDDILSNESACKLRVLIKNSNTDAFLVYQYQKSGFSFEKMGKFYEKKQKGEVIAPYGKEAFVVKVVGNDYRHQSFVFHPEGLHTASMNVPAIQPPSFALKLGAIDQYDQNGVTVKLTNVSEKKGITSVILEVSLKATEKNSLMILDPSQLELVTADGIVIESDVRRDKLRGVQAGDSRKINFSYTSTEPVSIKWNNTLKVTPLIPVLVDPITIVDKVVVSRVTSSDRVASNCAPFTGQQTGNVNMVIQANAGVCFKLDLNGFPVVPDFSSAASIYVKPGRQKMTFTFPDGTVVEESSIINNWYSSVGYNVVLKKNGTYVVRYDVFAQVLSPEGEQQRTAMMTRATTSSASAQVSNTTESNGSTLTTSASKSEGGCYGPESSGATSVRLKITWNGNPVANHAIRISQNGKSIGVGATDASGVAKIYTNGLNNPQIDIEGCSGSKSWSVSGSYCVLDSSNNLELPLDVIAREIGNLLGITLAEIGSSWGF